jgi:hypothetical protein
MKFGVPRKAPGATSGRTGLVGAPSPARAARPRPFDLGLRCVDRGSRRPRTWVGGWVGGTTEFRGCLGSRPRLAGTPVLYESVPAGCHATGCGPVSTRCHTQIAQDHRMRYMSRTHAVYLPHPLIKGCSRPAVALISTNLSDDPSARRNRTTASRVAPDSHGLLQDGRAPNPGTAASATTGSGSSANPATSVRAGS